jgi:NAD-dependent protein deacetylase/lipoamidase
MADLMELVNLFLEARRPVVFTGAGVSTESGIPDFRSPGGVWDRYKPIDFRDFIRDAEARRETWRRGLQTYPVLARAQPNPAHLAIAELERLGKLELLITQNIDGLHTRAGSSAERLVELHGNAHGVRCLDCEDYYQREAVHERVLAGETEPGCLACGGWLKPTTISFGEQLPIEAIQKAERATRACDLFLVVGSSLVVYPAAALPELALQRGARLAIVNASSTHLDEGASFHSDQPAGQVLAELMTRLRPRLFAARN